MKRSYKTMLGVTLLEIMLVLAIAALIIIMSIRFYQSASTSNKVNAAMSTIQGIVAAGENYLSAGNGSTLTMPTGILPYLPGGVMPNSPWGGKATIVGAANGIYTISMSAPGVAATGSAPVSGSPCSQLQISLNQNAKFTATCSDGQISVQVTE
jgi:Tfp pilus assembly protein PilE